MVTIIEAFVLTDYTPSSTKCINCLTASRIRMNKMQINQNRVSIIDDFSF